MSDMGKSLICLLVAALVLTLFGIWATQTSRADVVTENVRVTTASGTCFTDCMAIMKTTGGVVNPDELVWQQCSRDPETTHVYQYNAEKNSLEEVQSPQFLFIEE